ncbi:hypothetical protein [Haloplanus salinarum]|uniref:hypothetical protein n=1 Tax=Haloplanus salinarum TaxID=1912324 RepID=UPI00214C5C4B|nr:hypothetical protein [Haloplanus salinarum]
MTTDSISNSDSYDELTNSSAGVTTDEAQDRLKDTIFSALNSAENTIVNAPTSLGKSHQIATTAWREYPEVTGSNLVIHIHQTTDARREAVERSKATDGVEFEVFEGREDCCPVAAGDFDHELTAPHGLAPSEWFDWMCDVRKIGFAKAHSQLEGVCDCPCSEQGKCPSLKQWWQTLRDEDGRPTVDVVHTTANFAHVAELIDGANLVFDERPDYALTLGDTELQQIRDSISNLLDYRSDGEYAISDVITANRHGDSELTEELRSLLDEEISRDWYFRREETHRLAPAIGLAILNAEEILENRWAGEDANFSGRRMGKHRGLEVVMNSSGKLRHIDYSPDLSEARCVLGLDAFPSDYRWQLNTVDDLTRANVLSPKERRIWRRNERGLKIVQLGDATRSYTGGWDGAGKERSAGLIHILVRKHGGDFGSCITASKIEDDVRQQMTAAGIEKPRTMHYGAQNSRNDFGNEGIGLLAGCIDPGDKNILDLLALGGRYAWPEMITTEEGEKKRKPGRSFVGPDSDTAQDILVSVRESNIAQAAGRYARDPRSPGSSALVYVWSDACPESLTDEVIEVSYHSFTDAREDMVDALQNGCRTTTDVVGETGSDRSYVLDCLDQFCERNLVNKSERTGKYGATEWEWLGGEVGTTKIHVHLDC